MKNKNFPNNHCFQFAISNETGISTFYENEISHTNSLLKINDSSKDAIKKTKEYELSHISKNDKADEFIRQHRIESIDLLKVDVQGAESYVLKVRWKPLKITKNANIEVSFFDYYEKKSSLKLKES